MTLSDGSHDRHEHAVQPCRWSATSGFLSCSLHSSASTWSFWSSGGWSTPWRSRGESLGRMWVLAPFALLARWRQMPGTFFQLLPGGKEARGINSIGPCQQHDYMFWKNEHARIEDGSAEWARSNRIGACSQGKYRKNGRVRELSA